MAPRHRGEDQIKCTFQFQTAHHGGQYSALWRGGVINTKETQTNFYDIHLMPPDLASIISTSLTAEERDAPQKIEHFHQALHSAGVIIL